MQNNHLDAYHFWWWEYTRRNPTFRAYATSLNSIMNSLDPFSYPQLLEKAHHYRDVLCDDYKYPFWNFEAVCLEGLTVDEIINLEPEKNGYPVTQRKNILFLEHDLAGENNNLLTIDLNLSEENLIYNLLYAKRCHEKGAIHARINEKEKEKLEFSYAKKDMQIGRFHQKHAVRAACLWMLEYIAYYFGASLTGEYWWDPYYGVRPCRDLDKLDKFMRCSIESLLDSDYKKDYGVYETAYKSFNKKYPEIEIGEHDYREYIRTTFCCIAQATPLPLQFSAEQKKSRNEKLKK